MKTKQEQREIPHHVRTSIFGVKVNGLFDRDGTMVGVIDFSCVERELFCDGRDGLGDSGGLDDSGLDDGSGEEHKHPVLSFFVEIEIF